MIQFFLQVEQLCFAVDDVERVYAHYLQQWGSIHQIGQVLKLQGDCQLVVQVMLGLGRCQVHQTDQSVAQGSGHT
ncbi:hypothetical protein D9M71_814350 [compost metagenome]